jgi:uncharacterized Fe-S cluster-containing radical SAM superfamily protein
MGIIFWILVLSYPVGLLFLGCVYRLTGKGKRLYDACSFGIFREKEKKKQLQKELEEQMKERRPKKTFKIRRWFPNFSGKNNE